MPISTKEDYERRKATKIAEQEKRFSESWKTRFNDPITVFTAALAITAIVQCWALIRTDIATHDLAKTALAQAEAANNQVVAMQGQIDEAKAAREIMQGQLAAMESDQRPWLRVSPIPGRLSVSEGVFSIDISFSYTNTGKSPAGKVRDHIGIYVSGKSLTKEQDDVCKIAELAPRDYRPTIFPNDAPSAAITNWTLNGNKTGEFKMPVPGNPILPAIVGCVVYETTFDNKIHHTRYAFDIGKISLDGRLESFTDRTFQTTESDQITFRYILLGRNDAD